MNKDIRIQKGEKPKIVPNQDDSVIAFHISGNHPTPVLELKENGEIFHNGKLIGDDKEIVQGLKEFVNGTCITKQVLKDKIDKIFREEGLSQGLFDIFRKELGLEED